MIDSESQRVVHSSKSKILPLKNDTKQQNDDLICSSVNLTKTFLLKSLIFCKYFFRKYLNFYLL